MSWWEGYVGLPFAAHGRDRTGVDCWGLARMVLSEQCGLHLPSHAGDYIDVSERRALDALIHGGAQDGTWHRSIQPRAFDLALFTVGGFGSHIAVVIDAGHMLHVHSNSHAVIARLKDPMWRDRLAGIYRHEALA